MASHPFSDQPSEQEFASSQAPMGRAAKQAGRGGGGGQGANRSTTDTETAAQKAISAALGVLRDARISPWTVFAELVDPKNADYVQYQNKLYANDNEKLFKILNTVASSRRGEGAMTDWMWADGRLENLVEDVVDKEMEILNKIGLRSGIESLTPDELREWKVPEFGEQAPFVTSILFRASQSDRGKKNRLKTPDMFCNIILNCILYQRSQRCSSFAAAFGLFLWSSGASKQVIESLHKASITVSYPTILTLVKSLGSKAMEVNRQIAEQVAHLFAYDNVNISTSIHVEQRGKDTPAKVTSGTLGVLYPLLGATLEDVALEPILDRFKSLKEGLELDRDLTPSREQLSSFSHQLKILVIRILIKYEPGFAGYLNHPDLQHKVRRKIPANQKTDQYPLRVSTIEEATVEGNIAFHKEAYVTQLQQTPETLSKLAIPTINDQLTNARIRKAQAMRVKDVDAWQQRLTLQPGFGLFHAAMNLEWLLLNVHRGPKGSPGSLEYFFTVMEKTRLSGEHPDYHTLDATFSQILDGVIISAWEMVCGAKFKSDLKKFAKSKPSAEHLLQLADKIIHEYATPTRPATSHVPPTREELGSDVEGDSSSDESDELEADEDDGPTCPPSPPNAGGGQLVEPDEDVIFNNMRKLTRDLLYVAELNAAVSAGDWGRIEDFLPLLAMMYRGAGGNNYCTELLHFILNLKYIWTPKFADIMRDNMIINPSGREGHAVGVDRNIEHLIKALKTLLGAKGVESTWDQLGNISAALNSLLGIKKATENALGTAYHARGHKTPKTTKVVDAVRKAIKRDQLLRPTLERQGLSTAEDAVAQTDVLHEGFKKLRSSTLNTFNQKVVAMANGLRQTGTFSDGTVPRMAQGTNEDGEEESELATDEVPGLPAGFADEVDEIDDADEEFDDLEAPNQTTNHDDFDDMYL